MKWSWKIAEFRGIGVFVHATFLILIGFVVTSHWAVGHDLAKTLEGVAFVLALFTCVVLHEFGHALTAARYGIRTRDITLFPIGGVARLERMPEEPTHELWVALAGPAVNLAIAAAIFLALQVFGAAIGPVEGLSLTEGSLLERLMVVNAGLAAFNLLPAFPMDGGRVLRAGLATRMSYARATRIAANAGQAMALLFGLVGFFTNPFLMFIAIFVWIGAAQEAGLVELRAALTGIPVARAMETVFHVLAPSDRLTRAVDETLASAQQDFPVLEGSAVVGLLTRKDLLEGLARRGADSTVGDSMQRDFVSIEATEMLDSAFRRLEGKANRTLPVVRGGALVGLVTLDNVGDVVAIRSALEARRAARRPLPAAEPMKAASLQPETRRNAMSELDRLLAERAITRVLYRYAQGIDRRDFEQVEACYWPDGYDSHGSFEGTIPDYVAWLRKVLPAVAVSSHHYGNVLIDVELAAGTAKSEAYCDNTSVFPDGRQKQLFLRYLDEWQQRDGEWRISRRKVVEDWSRKS